MPGNFEVEYHYCMLTAQLVLDLEAQSSDARSPRLRLLGPF